MPLFGIRFGGRKSVLKLKAGGVGGLSGGDDRIKKEGLPALATKTLEMAE